MRIFFLLLTTVITAKSSAQTDQRFIEFTLSDTVQVVPDKLLYEVVFRNEHDMPWTGDDPFNTMQQQNEEKQKQAQAAFFKICSQLNIHPEVRESSKYAINGNNYLKRYTLTFKSEKELSQFYEQAKELSLRGSVTDRIVNPRRIESAKARLMTKLRNMASAEAIEVAKHFNKNSGELLSLKIEPEDTVYSVQPLEGTFDFPWSLVPEELLHTIHMKITLRYAIR